MHQTQKRLNYASSSLEAQFESGLADMLTRVKKTEDETAQLKAEEEKAAVEEMCSLIHWLLFILDERLHAAVRHTLRWS